MRISHVGESQLFVVLNELLVKVFNGLWIVVVVVVIDVQVSHGDDLFVGL